MAGTPLYQPDGLSMGPDKVWFVGESVVIYAVREMMDWDVREFCRIAIDFQGSRYYLSEQTRTAPPYAVRYTLKPWPANRPDLPSRMIVYDAAYVAQREQASREERRSVLGRLVLLPFYPCLGLLWSHPKQKLIRFGFNPASITAGSVFMIFCLAFVGGIFVGYLGFFGVVQCLALILLFGDVVVRYHQLLQDAERPWGFLEWLFEPLFGVFSDRK